MAFCSVFYFKPSNLVPFKARQQHVAGVTNNNKVSSVQYVEIHLYGSQIRLLLGNKVTINGISTSTPYSGLQGTTINRVGGRLVLTTNFSFVVTWDGVSRVVYTIPGSYAGNVCGLCGNADGECRSFVFLQSF